jgi:hypothetical protein
MQGPGRAEVEAAGARNCAFVLITRDVEMVRSGVDERAQKSTTTKISGGDELHVQIPEGQSHHPSSQGP